MEKKESRDRVIEAISKSSFRWRTPRGIAKDSGVPLPQVLETLERSEGFIRARKGNSQGEPLYTTKEKYKKTSSLGERIISAITNKISD